MSSTSTPTSDCNGHPSFARFYSDAVLAQVGTVPVEDVQTGFSKVLVIYTGGTIGMQNSGENGYTPSPNNLFRVLSKMPRFHSPDLGVGFCLESSMFIDDNVAQVPALITPPSLWKKRILYSFLEYKKLLDSSNMTATEWARIATDIEKNYDFFDAFVVLHGTDTMAYTASALSFMLQNLGKTVILTGSQIPLQEYRNDAVENLLGALIIAGHYVIPEVTLYFHNQLFRGNRCSKTDTVGFNSFSSYNFPPLATVGVNIDVNWQQIRQPNLLQAFRVHKQVCTDVAVIRLFPGMSDHFVEVFLQEPIRGVVIETYGAGHAPDNRPALLAALRDACQRGVVIVNCTQCSRGTVTDLYKTGKELYRAGVVAGNDMTVEAALTKLSYLLGLYPNNPDAVRKNILTNLRGELTEICQERTKFLAPLSELQMNLQITNSPNDQTSAQLMVSIIASRGLAAYLVEIIKKFPHVKPNEPDFSGSTPLHHAIQSGNLATVECLVNMSSSREYPMDKMGYSPLGLAIKMSKVDIVRYLMQKNFEKHESEQ